MSTSLLQDLRPLINTASLDPGPLGGFIPHRLPPAVREQIVDPFMEFASAEGSGTTLRFRTRSDVVRLTVSTSILHVPGFPRPDPVLVVRTGDRSDVIRLQAGAIDFDPIDQTVQTRGGDPQELLLHRAVDDDLITVLLPHNAQIEFLSLEADEPLLPAGDEPVWLHYGSSISHCTDAESPALTWPMQVADALGWRLRNLGLSGQAQLDQSVARYMRDIPADLITIKVGINIVGAGSMRQRVFRSAVHGFLDTVRDGHPDTPIVVISAIACQPLEQAMGPGSIVDGLLVAPPTSADPGADALTLSRSRTILAEIVRQRARFDRSIAYLDGLELLGTADVHLLPDAVHPNQKGMDLIARRFTTRIASLAQIRGVVG